MPVVLTKVGMSGDLENSTISDREPMERFDQYCWVGEIYHIVMLENKKPNICTCEVAETGTPEEFRCSLVC